MKCNKKYSKFSMKCNKALLSVTKRTLSEEVRTSTKNRLKTLIGLRELVNKLVFIFDRCFCLCASTLFKIFALAKLYGIENTVWEVVVLIVIFGSK